MCSQLLYDYNLFYPLQGQFKFPAEIDTPLSEQDRKVFGCLVKNM